MGVKLAILVMATTIVVRAQDVEDADQAARERFATAVGTVRVIDGEGRPVAGVPVGAYFPLGDREIAAVIGTDYAVSRSGMPPLDVVGETAADGRCRLPIQYGGMPLAIVSLIVGPRRQSVDFRIRAPFANPPSRRFLIHDLGSDDIVLTLPRSIRLRVKIVAADGSIDQRPSRVGIERLDPGPANSSLDGRLSPATGAVVVPAKAGIAEFPFVGQGQTVVVSARIHGEDTVRFREIAIAAAVDAPEIVVSLGPTDIDRDVVWSARLIGQGDRPLAHRDVELRFRTADSLVDRTKLETEPRIAAPSIVRARTDENGRLDVALNGVADPGPWIETAVEIDVMNSRLGVPELATTIFAKRGLRRGRDDFGDVRVTSSTFYFAGVVVDELGRPIAGAHVSVSSLEFGVFGMRVPQPSRNGREFAYIQWTPIEGGSATSRADGFFALTGSPRRGPFLVSCEKLGFLETEPVLLDRAPNIGNLRMRSAAVVEGRVILDGKVPREFVTINVDGKFDAFMPRRALAPRWSADFLFDAFTRGVDYPIEADGRIVIPALPKGFAAISVRVSAMKFVKVENVQLDPGVVVRPPELSSVDLRGRTKTYRFVVKDEKGNPIEGASVGFFSRDMSRGPARAGTDASGRCSLVTLGDAPPEFFVSGPTSRRPWRDLNVTPVAEETEVILERPDVVTVKVTNVRALPRAPYFMSVVFDRENAEKSEKVPFLSSAFGSSPRGAVIDGSGVGTVALPEAGRYAVKVVIGVIMPDLGWDVPVEFNGPTTVDLAADGNDTVEIEVTGDAWLKAVQSASRSLFQ